MQKTEKFRKVAEISLCNSGATYKITVQDADGKRRTLGLVKAAALRELARGTIETVEVCQYIQDKTVLQEA